MKKNLFLFLLLVISLHTSFAQLKSPDEFLGYPIGTKFTPHHKIVNYFQQVAAALPQQVKLQQYGQTYEGRPLYLAFISSAANITNLESIRKNNLQLAGVESGAANNTSTPIVWLSYNVHGNEASSSEAAMQTIYELLKPEHTNWLSNTVVIMDPCLNPDGRDRYVNWFNGMVGSNANANPVAREHDEPWPGGRINHYNFDLNRDWAWQTQIETQQRLKMYNQWLPQVHVDYHEQGYNEPYYFAPAAAPFHEVITSWQKDFQTTIGKNNARYFDNNGWLYFTKERFDLFYPSYGDTYPTYNGSIGMTYEQGGHSRGGLAVQTDEGEVLTLKDRLMHHTTTGLSTVEITAANAAKVIAEYKKYFDNAKAGVGSQYKSYLLTSDDESRIISVMRLLEANNIKFGIMRDAIKQPGYNYFNGKIGPVEKLSFTVAVNANQPKSILAKVLLEPLSKLEDTATYDITAWSIPYAYGVNAYAFNNYLPIVDDVAVDRPGLQENIYGAVLPYNSVASSVMLARLLNNNVGVRVNEKDIVYNGKKIRKGSLLILKRDNISNWKQTINLINETTDAVTILSSGFMDAGPDMGSPDILKLAAPRVALVTGNDVNPNAAGEIWHLFEQQVKYPLTLLNGNRLRANTLKQFDVLILPDGDYSFIGDKKTGEDIKAWVRNGGRIIALESAVAQFADADWGVKIKKEDEEKKDDKKADYSLLRKYGDRERDDLVNSIPGAIYKVEMDETHPLAFGIGNTFYTLKQNSTVLEFSKEAWNVGVIKKENKVAGFAGVTVSNKIKDGTIFAVQDMGRGKVIYMVDDPVFRNFWENGKLLFLNAVFMVGNEPVRL